MGFYSRCIFPLIMDRAMSRPAMTEQRQRVLQQVRGEVLEIGFGTGLNLPHYPPHVRRLSVLDPNPGALRRARRRIEGSSIGVEQVPLVEHRDIAAADASFDTVVCTWTLCSIADVAHALAEVQRVLRPDGQFLFVEHGLSPDPRVAKWQHRLNPIQRRLGDGCNLNRDIAAIVGSSPLALERCETFYLPGLPRLGGYTYRGIARKRM